MPTFELLDKIPDVRKVNRAIAPYVEQVKNLVAGQAVGITPEGDETLRALVLRVRRAAKLAGVEVEVRKADDKLFMWLKVQPARRGRPRKAGTNA